MTSRGQLPVRKEEARRVSRQKAEVCVSVCEECLPLVLSGFGLGEVCEDEAISAGGLEISVGKVGRFRIAIQLRV